MTNDFSFLFIYLNIYIYIYICISVFFLKLAERALAKNIQVLYIENSMKLMIMIDINVSVYVESFIIFYLCDKMC